MDNFIKSSDRSQKYGVVVYVKNFFPLLTQHRNIEEFVRKIEKKIYINIYDS